MCLRKLLPLFLLFTITELSAQEYQYYYFIYLKDKPASEFSIADPSRYLSQKAIDRRKRMNIALTEEDLPVHREYVEQLRSVPQCEVWNMSKWMNAVEVRLSDPEGINLIKALPFVRTTRFLGKLSVKPAVVPPPVDSQFLFLKPLDPRSVKGSTPGDYGESAEQNNLIHMDWLYKRGFRGQGISIAIFDAGFHNAYKTPGMNIDPVHIMVRDFVTHDNSVWEDDRHGANVLGFMKVYNPGTYVGTAPAANYMLFRTEDAATEYPVEEVNWVAAAELADSMGVDLISSSLGYSIFDDNSLSHVHSDLDGKTSIIAKAANIAHSKGIAIVVSAGNEGSQKWHKIGTPSDATGVITIGATDNEGTHADFSSYGPSADGRTKPDFVVMGKKAIVANANGTYAGNGTSYATPIFAGALACLMQACPDKNYEQILEALRLSSTHYSAPDSAYGYGIPDIALAMEILGNSSLKDSAKDILWNNPQGSYWQNQTIHFYSAGKQTVELKITGLRKHKIKTISRKTYTLDKGEWLHNSDLHELIARQQKAKKRKKITEIYMELSTAGINYQRSFKDL